MRVRGFTLVEVLVALVIVTFGMAAVLASITSAADSTAFLREKSFAEWVAMNRIAELRLQVRRPAEGKSSGDTEFAGRRWRWEQEITKLDVPGTHQIEVRVRPAETQAQPGRRAETAWLATVRGAMGDAVDSPNGQPLDWGGVTGPGGGRRGGRSEPTRAPQDEPQEPGTPREREETR